MIDSGTRDFDAARAATAASIAPVHATDFQRLVKLLRHAARFQLLFIEFADAGDRDALAQRIDEVPAVAAMPVARIDLIGSGAPDSFDELEQRLRRLSVDHPAVHLVGAEAWFDDRRWCDFNVRREAVAYGAPMKLKLWLTAQAVRRCIAVAPDLWSWRGGLFSFAPTVRQAAPAAAPGPVHATAPATPAVAPGAALDRLAQVQRLLHEQPDASPLIRLQLHAEVASLLGTEGQHEAAEAGWRDTVLPRARALGDGHLVLRAAQEMADLLARRGELDAALQLLSNPEIVQAANGVAALYLLPMQRAWLLRGARRKEQALQVLQAEALPQAKGLNDAFALTPVHELIADVLEDLRRYDEALRWRREQELPATALEHNPARRAQVHDRIAALLERLGRLDEAVVERQQRQIPLLRAGRDEAALGHGQARLADLMHRRGESAAALSLYRDEVLPAFERTGELAAQARTWRRMAELLRSTGQVGAALAAVRDQALPLARRSAGVLEEVDTLTSYAKLLSDAGQPQQALQVVEQALLPLLREPQQRPHLADALGQRARIQRRLGDHGAALDT